MISTDEDEAHRAWCDYAKTSRLPRMTKDEAMISDTARQLEKAETEIYLRKMDTPPHSAVGGNSGFTTGQINTLILATSMIVAGLAGVLVFIVCVSWPHLVAGLRYLFF